ncbi:MAG: hypothetical protein J4F41_01940 [Alphaproteobacteria bacterium]|nr:hypothetical protein [Alphaproteobacteria bacterium]
MTGFDLFIGIDWSGGQAEHQKGIQLAEAAPGHAAPTIIPPPHPKGWSRAQVMAHLLAHKHGGRRVLAGIDFAFCHAHGGDGYYPGLAGGPQTPAALWEVVEQANQSAPYLYGGGIWGDAGLRAYYNAPNCRDGRGGKGARYQSRRRRTEELAATRNGRSPSPTFNCVGPAGVGTGSLAGMRLLHHMAGQAWVWPITPQDEVARLKREAGLLALVEIYPALYFTMAGVKDAAKKAAPLDALNTALAHFHSTPVADVATQLPDHDDLDAAVSAAALRALHDPENIFPVPSPEDASARLEGWIFGAG